MTSSGGGGGGDHDHGVGDGGPPSARPHVLVVEDSPLVSSALRILLEETGRRVTIAASVREAVAALEASRAGGDSVALMLLDLTLPDGDGTAVLDAARAAGSVPAVTVAMTGHDDEPTRQRCLAAGCAEVLVKPVPSRELLRRVGEWVGTPGA